MPSPPLIDLTPNKTTFNTSDYISVTANVFPISTRCYPFVRIVMPSGQTLYYERGKGFKLSPTPYLGFRPGAITVRSPITGYTALKSSFRGVSTGTYYLKGGAVDPKLSTAYNLIYVGALDRETLTVH